MKKIFFKTLLIGGVIVGLELLTACRWFSTTSQARDQSAQPDATEKGRIEGRVLDEERRPIAQVVIVIIKTTAMGEINEIAPVTNETGEFGFSDLPPGQYTLRATRDGYRTHSLTVTVANGKTASAEFLMRK